MLIESPQWQIKRFERHEMQESIDYVLANNRMPQSDREIIERVPVVFSYTSTSGNRKGLIFPCYCPRFVRAKAHLNGVHIALDSELTSADRALLNRLIFTQGFRSNEYVLSTEKVLVPAVLLHESQKSKGFGRAS